MDAESWFRTLAVASLADGVLDERETALLLRCTAWLGLPHARASRIMGEVRAGGAGGAVPKSPADRRRLLGSVLDVVLADGRLTDDEARCVHGLAETLEVSPEETSAMIVAAQGRWRAFEAARSIPVSAPAEEEPLAEGTLVGDHFRIVRPLGEGGFAAVYRARHEVLGVDVALKVLLRSTIAESRTAERRFLQEARLCRSFSHRYIAAVREVGRDHRHGPYIAMDLVPGRTLGDILARDGPQPRERFLDLAFQTLEALEEVHRAGVVHRDVKPDNIMVMTGPLGDEEVRLIDFGIAKDLTLADDPKLTTDGSIMGSVTYMSPEQAQGLKLDGRSDLYSFAVVLYEALCGCLPYQMEPFAEDFCRSVIVKIVVEPPRDPLALEATMPPLLAGALMRTLAKKPDERPASARELREALGVAIRAT